MNRSLQSIAALLISLSGAMLAVLWTPGDGPRPPATSVSSRRRAAVVPCGFIATREPAALRKIPAAAIAPPEPAPLDSAMGTDRLAESTTALASVGKGLIQSPASQAVADAFALSLRPLWPLRAEAALADQSLRDDDRRRIEAEYAAAELAAAAPPSAPWVADRWRQVTDLAERVARAAHDAHWLTISNRVADQLNEKYEEMIAYFGWQETLPTLLAHARRQHQRLVLREALLRELDRGFLDQPVLEPQQPLPQKPKYRPKGRRLYLAAADALKTLSRALDAAAAQLETVSREDVAELHTVGEKSEEKR